MGGDTDIYAAIPKVTGTPSVLSIGNRMLTLFAELEGIGRIIACAVENNDLNSANPPNGN